MKQKIKGRIRKEVSIKGKKCENAKKGLNKEGKKEKISDRNVLGV